MATFACGGLTRRDPERGAHRQVVLGGGALEACDVWAPVNTSSVNPRSTGTPSPLPRCTSARRKSSTGLPPSRRRRGHRSRRCRRADRQRQPRSRRCRSTRSARRARPRRPAPPTPRGRPWNGNVFAARKATSGSASVAESSSVNVIVGTTATESRPSRSRRTSMAKWIWIDQLRPHGRSSAPRWLVADAQPAPCGSAVSRRSWRLLAAHGVTCPVGVGQICRTWSVLSGWAARTRAE